MVAQVQTQQMARRAPLPNIGGPNIHPPMTGQGRLVGMNPVQAPPTTMPMEPQVQPTAQPMAQTTAQQPMPQTGLAGFESALQGGLQGGLGVLMEGQQAAQGLLNRGVGALGGNFGVDPNTGQQFFTQAAEGVGAFSPAGLEAQRRQAALSGTLGQEAFDQALINNPAMQFLQEQGEQSIINQAASTGNLGGGNVQKELARFGQGLASQDLQRQIANQQALSQQGLQAAGQQGQFLSQAGQQQGNIALQNAANRLRAAQSQAGLFGQGAGLIGSLAGQGAGMIGNIAGQVGQGRLQTGRDIASQIGQTAGGLSSLINQQSGGLSDILGQSGVNIVNLLSGTSQQLSQQQLQEMLARANLATGQASQLSGIAGQTGQAAAQAALARGQNQQQLLGNLLGAAAAGGAFTPSAPVNPLGGSTFQLAALGGMPF